MTEKTNGIGTAADFKQLAEAAAWTEPERIVLPGSGLAVMIRRPTLMYFRLRRSAWPEGLIEKLEVAALAKQSPELTTEERLFMIREDVQLIQQAFVQPRMELHPGPDAIDPNWLTAQDSQFIMKFLGGEVLADGTDLEAFRRGQSGLAADGGDPGGGVRPEADGPTQVAPERLAN